jgi:hypothetical protein
MKNYTKNLLSLFVLASSVLLPVQAVLGTAASSHSLLPPELQLDQSMVDAINQCPGVENGFAQRYSAVVQDKQLLQQEADDIAEKKESIAASRVNVDKEEGYLNEFARSQSRMANELEALRKGLHKNHATKPLSAEATIIENEKILAYNKKSGEYNVITDQYNNLVIAQKKRIADHNALVASLNEMVARFNTHSLATQEPTNQLLRDVAKYQGECAVSRQAMSK